MKATLLRLLLTVAALLAVAGTPPAPAAASAAPDAKATSAPRGAADPRIKQVRGLSEENKKLKDELQALRDQLASQSQATLQARLDIARLETERASADKAAAEAERVASIERAAAAAAALKQSELELQAAQLNASTTAASIKARTEALALELRIAEAEVRKASEEVKRSQASLDALAAEERIASLQLQQSQEVRLTQQAAVRLAEINETASRLRVEEESAVHREGLRKTTLLEIAASDHKALKGAMGEVVRGLANALGKHANATGAAVTAGQEVLAEAVAAVASALAPALGSAVEAQARAATEALELRLQHAEALAERRAGWDEGLAARADERLAVALGAAVNSTAALAAAAAQQTQGIVAGVTDTAQALASRSEAASQALLTSAASRLAALVEGAVNATESGAATRTAATVAEISRLATAVEGLIPALTAYVDGILARREKLDADLARVQAEVEAEARIRAVRENEDVHARAAAAEAAATQARWLATVDAAAAKLAAGASALLSPSYGLPLLAGVVGAGAALAAAREAFGLAREALRRRLGRPSLLRVLKTRSSFGVAVTAVLQVVLAVATLGLSLLLPACLARCGCRRRDIAAGTDADPWADVLLDDELSKAVKRLATSTQTARDNAAPLRNVLLYGAAGTGKTLCAERLAATCGLDFGIMSGADVAPLGADAVTELNKLLSWAKNRRGGRGFLLLIDEAESFLMNRTQAASAGGSSSETLKHCLAAFLHHTGTTSDTLMLVLCTNRPGDIDSAVIDRCDEQLCFGLPDLPLRARLLRHYVSRYVVSRSQYRDLAPEVAATVVFGPASSSGGEGGSWTSDRRAVKAVAKRLAAGSVPARCCGFKRGASSVTGGPTIFLSPDACDPTLWTALAARCPGFSGRGINKLAAALQATAYAEGLKPVPTVPGVPSSSPPALGFVIDAATVLDVFAGETRKVARQAAARMVLTPRLIGPHLGGSSSEGGRPLVAGASSSSTSAASSNLASPMPRGQQLFVDTGLGEQDGGAALEEDPEFAVPPLRVPDGISGVGSGEAGSGSGGKGAAGLRHRKR